MRGAANVPMDPSVGALTVTSLTDETSQGVYCRRMRISALQCRQAWLGLCDFIFAQLKNQRGVSLPGLGSFAVGACVDTANGGVVAPRAPVFALSSPKFDGVPQARGRFFLVKPATYARVSTTAIAARCGVHKAGVAHVLKEMLGAIADRTSRGEPVDVDFSFARFVARRDDGTRAEMRFFPAFLEREMGLATEVSRSVPGPGGLGVRDRTFLPSRSDDAKARRAAMPAKVTGTTPALETAAAATRAAEDAADAFAVESRLAPTGSAAFESSGRPQSARRGSITAAAATHAGSAFLAMCARIDRLRVGHVERLRLERVLNDEDLCAGLVADVPVSVVRDTIRAASCGREGKFVAYLPVCRALEAAAVAARAARAAAAEDADARAARLREERLAAARAAEDTSETEAVADAAKRLAAAAIANVLRGPEDPAEPIAELFLSSTSKEKAEKTANGAGGAKARGFVGENLDEVTKFNLEYAAARSRFVAASAGGVTPKVTSNRAVELAAGERGTTNELGRFLQGQIDARGARESAEKASRVAEEEARNREAERSLALEKVAVAQSKKQSAEALRAGWDAQTSAKKEQKKSGRPPVRLVKFDALK